MHYGRLNLELENLALITLSTIALAISLTDAGVLPYISSRTGIALWIAAGISLGAGATCVYIAGSKRAGFIVSKTLVAIRFSLACSALLLISGYSWAIPYCLWQSWSTGISCNDGEVMRTSNGWLVLSRSITVCDEDVEKWIDDMIKLGATEVSLRNTKVTSRVLDLLAKVRSLMIIDVSGTVIGNGGMNSLVKLLQLETLLLSNTNVNDRDMQDIKKISQLRILNISNTAISDAGLLDIQDLKSLRTLSASDSNITPDGIQNLLSRIPDLEVFDLQDIFE